MDPEELLRFARNARDRGWTDEQINARLAETETTEFNSIDEARAALRSRGTARQDASAAPGPGPESDKSTFAGMDRVGRLAGEVFTLGAMDEGAATLRGAAEGAAALVPGGRSPGEAFRQGRRKELEASRERLREAQEGAGPGTKALGFAAGLLGPSLPIRAAAGASKAARFGIPALKGGILGAAEGGAYGAMSADPDPDKPMSENLKERAGAALWPSILGGAGGAVAGPLLAGRAASKAKPTAGKRLGKAAREESGLSGRASRVTEDVAQRKKTIRREQFTPLEDIGQVESPAVQRALRADDVKPVVKDLFPDIAKGERAPTFLELQKVQKRLEGLRDRAVRSGDSFELDRFGRASREVTDAMEEAVEGFPEARKAWAREAQRLRALEDARKTWTKTADDVEKAFRDLPDDPQVRDAFKEGLAAEFVARLEKLSEPKAVLRQIENSPQLRGKLKVLFGSDDALKQFTKEALGEGRLRNRAHLYERVKRWAIPLGAAAAGGSGGKELVSGIL